MYLSNGHKNGSLKFFLMTPACTGSLNSTRECGLHAELENKLIFVS